MLDVVVSKFNIAQFHFLTLRMISLQMQNSLISLAGLNDQLDRLDQRSE